ncbi:hypothetical protein GN958_ATG17843 [Phytophthora infestans]|uniref:Uncharacterized protein n=1 Tax=Phytophthora infestans TaxID=4787 RepID=A0A8S9U205_PHYIN|nr:hypothetical protein GN958_ATG17843 [Phytophthora infestans]
MAQETNNVDKGVSCPPLCRSTGRAPIEMQRRRASHRVAEVLGRSVHCSAPALAVHNHGTDVDSDTFSSTKLTFQLASV